MLSKFTKRLKSVFGGSSETAEEEKPAAEATPKKDAASAAKKDAKDTKDAKPAPAAARKDGKDAPAAARKDTPAAAKKDAPAAAKKEEASPRKATPAPAAAASSASSREPEAPVSAPETESGVTLLDSGLIVIDHAATPPRTPSATTAQASQPRVSGVSVAPDVEWAIPSSSPSRPVATGSDWDDVLARARAAVPPRGSQRHED